MKGLVAAGVFFTVIALALGSASAREKVGRGIRPVRDWSPEEFAGQEVTAPAYLTEAAVDTYTIVNFTFEAMNWQGWTRVDNTTQLGPFFHVDDFAGLGGGFRGHLIPLEGTKSMWCGARPNPSDPYLCSFKKLPGYGNGWDQNLSTVPITVVGAVTWSFKMWYDSEPDYDYTHIEYDAGGLNWTSIADYDGHGNTVASFFIPITTTRTKLRFHFTSDGAWSDEDGLWNTDGACVVDSINVRDLAGYYNYEDFEAAAVGAKSAGIWVAGTKTPFGNYSGLKSSLADKDPCGDNLSTQVVFFVGSTYPSADYPGLYETPFCKGETTHDYPCQDEIVLSPVIDMTKYSTGNNEVQDADIPAGERPKLGGTRISFTVYRDLPLSNLVFYTWRIRKVVGGCPSYSWYEREFVYYGPEKEYVYYAGNISDLIAGDDPVQISIQVLDMCSVWYLSVGNCAYHTPSPWFDNVKLQRYDTYGPQWSYRDLDLFQDNFPPQAAPPWGTVRADAANDLRANNQPGIDPGDSIVVNCVSLLGGGIDTTANGRPQVYMWVKAHWIGAGAPPLGTEIHGVQLQGTYGTWLATVGSWDKIQCDFSRTQAGVVADKFMVDLNDSLFVPGYIIEYYFTARDHIGQETSLPNWARSREPYFEFTCLPTGTSDFLYVDDFQGRGSWDGMAQNYWDQAFRAVLPLNNRPDRYDVNGPTSGVSNGPGSRANAALLRYQYRVIVWDSGDIQDNTISDGTTNSDKSNDCQLLVDWMSQASHGTNLWVCGDNIASDLTLNDNLSAPARALMQTWCGVTLANKSYFDVTGGRTGGGVVIPLVTGVRGSIFFEGGVPDKFYAYGGCPTINTFDCLGKTGNGIYAFAYPDYQGAHYYAGIQAESVNSNGRYVRTVWFGLSFMYIRDDNLAAPMDRFEIAQDVFSYLNNITRDPFSSAGTTPAVNKLAQNIPNPFNPVTTIKYDMKEKGVVTLKIYNVAGQLVRTLVDGVKDAGSYKVVWDGKNNIDLPTASGIYFYKMETKGFSKTKKMVLLR